MSSAQTKVVALVRSKDFREAESCEKPKQRGLHPLRGAIRSPRDTPRRLHPRSVHDLSSRGIRINVIGPGVTDTPMLEDSSRRTGRDRILNSFASAVARPEEQADILICLNSRLGELRQRPGDNGAMAASSTGRSLRTSSEKGEKS